MAKGVGRGTGTTSTARPPEAAPRRRSRVTRGPTRRPLGLSGPSGWSAWLVCLVGLLGWSAWLTHWVGPAGPSRWAIPLGHPAGPSRWAIPLGHPAGPSRWACPADRQRPVYHGRVVLTAPWRRASPDRALSRPRLQTAPPDRVPRPRRLHGLRPTEASPLAAPEAPLPSCAERPALPEPPLEDREPGPGPSLPAGRAPRAVDGGPAPPQAPAGADLPSRSTTCLVACAPRGLMHPLGATPTPRRPTGIRVRCRQVAGEAADAPARSPPPQRSLTVRSALTLWLAPGSPWSGSPWSGSSWSGSLWSGSL